MHHRIQDRIKPPRWERLPVRWMCRRRCTLQHVYYQTTISGGPPNTRIFYETVVDGQHLTGWNPSPRTSSGRCPRSATST